MILSFAPTWGRWYRVLRHRKRFSFADSVRDGLRLARSLRFRDQPHTDNGRYR